MYHVNSCWSGCLRRGGPLWVELNTVSTPLGVHQISSSSPFFLPPSLPQVQENQEKAHLWNRWSMCNNTHFHAYYTRVHIHTHNHLHVHVCSSTPLSHAGMYGCIWACRSLHSAYIPKHGPVVCSAVTCQVKHTQTCSSLCLVGRVSFGGRLVVPPQLWLQHMLAPVPAQQWPYMCMYACSVPSQLVFTSLLWPLEWYSAGYSISLSLSLDRKSVV